MASRLCASLSPPVPAPMSGSATESSPFSAASVSADRVQRKTMDSELRQNRLSPATCITGFLSSPPPVSTAQPGLSQPKRASSLNGSDPAFFLSWPETPAGRKSQRGMMFTFQGFTIQATSCARRSPVTIRMISLLKKATDRREKVSVSCINYDGRTNGAGGT